MILRLADRPDRGAPAVAPGRRVGAESGEKTFRHRP